MRRGAGEGATGARAYIFEDEIAAVAKQGVRERERAMEDFHGVVEDLGIGGEDVFLSIVVKVEDANAPTGESACGSRDSRFAGDVLKLPAAGVGVGLEAVADTRGFE